MKPRLLPLSAALLSVFVIAHKAEAAPSSVCAQIKDLPPISQSYTQPVLARADEGIAYARTFSQDTDFERYRSGWAGAIAAGWAGLIDSQVTKTDEQQELLHASACLQFDLTKLDCKMEEVRTELRAQLERGSFEAIRRLLSLLEFLSERRRNLQLGALDPLYSDPGWGKHYDFDSPNEVVCCPGSIPGNACTFTTQEVCENDGGAPFQTVNECTAWGCGAPVDTPKDDGVLCPFNADYAPPFQSGFGCDIEAMSGRSDYPPLQAEFEALTLIIQKINDARAQATALSQAQGQIDEIYGNFSSSTPSAQSARTHLNAFGCGWTSGYCTDDLSKKCATDDDCGEGGSCEQPGKICGGNRVVRCINDATCGAFGPCMEEAALPSVRELRGPFSADKDHVSILSEFLGVRAMEEVSREFRDDLKTPNEFDDGANEPRAVRAFEERNPFVSLFRSATRIEVQDQSRAQGRQDAAIFPEAVDSQLEIAESLKGLRSAVSTLAKLASAKDGLRQFVARYAYFLRRSCVSRPCSLLLEQVIRISTADECFPYSNGEYLSDTESNPRWQKCKSGAGIN